MPQPVIYKRPNAIPEGPLPLYHPPPGQPTLDATMREPPKSQAMYTTYPSRMRTGVTSLLQPETITGGPREREAFMAEFDREMGSAKAGSGASTPARFDSPAPTGRRGGRRQVNYAEMEESSEEESEPEEPPSDPEDSSYAGGARGKRRGDDVQGMARAGRLKKRKDELDKGWTWLGERTPAEWVRGAQVRPSRMTYPTEEELAAEAARPEMLVPISIDLEVENAGVRLKDRFLWNVNEPFLTPKLFAEMLCRDLDLPADLVGVVTELINSQIEEAQAVAEIDVRDGPTTADEIDWAEKEVEVVEDEEEEVWKEADQRIIVNVGPCRDAAADDQLDVQIYTHILRDRIEWDLSSSLPASTFAALYARDLGLSGEAVPLIAHAITEELLKHKKDALDWQLFKRTHPTEQAKCEHPHGASRPRVSAKNAKSGAEGLKGVWRDWWEREEFGPILVELDYAELERREADRVREARRTNRGVMGRKRR